MNGYDAQIAARALNLDGAADQPRDENGRWSAGSAPNAHSKLWAERVTQVASSVRELNQRSNTLFKENVAAAQDARKFAENIDKNLDVGDSDETTKDAAVKEEAWKQIKEEYQQEGTWPERAQAAAKAQLSWAFVRQAHETRINSLLRLHQKHF